MNFEMYERIKNVLADKNSRKKDYIELLDDICYVLKPLFEDNQGKCKMVSLDTSSKKTGWAYFEAGELVSSGVINHSKETDSEIRVEDMIMSVFNLLDKYSPDIVVVEKNTVGRNAKTERMLGHIVGSVKGWALANYKEFDMLSPSEWRKAVKKDVCCPRKREEAKEWAIQRVYEIYGKETEDDEADAILIGTALIKLRDSRNTN